jgi:predicted MFS family arabinose efflux permease
MTATLLQRLGSPADVEMKRVTAYLLISMLGSAILNLLPWMVEILVDELGATTAQAGALASAQLGGSALGYVIALFFGARIGNARMALWGAIVSLCAFVGSVSIHSLSVVAIFWTLSGIGAGLAAVSSYRSAAVESNPKFFYSAMCTAQMTFGLVAYLAMPYANASQRWMVYVVLAVLCLGAAWAAQLMRDDTRPSDTTRAKGSILRASLGAAAFLLSGSLGLHFVANSMQWSFFDRVGVVSGLDAVTISRALALSMLGGLAGAALSAVELGRHSERKVIVLGIMAIIVSNLLLMAPNTATYVMSALLMNFSVMWVQPSYLSFLARLPRGTAAVTWGQFQTSIGLMVGPFIGGLLLGGLGVQIFVLCVVGLFVCALALALTGFTLQSRQR